MYFKFKKEAAAVVVQPLSCVWLFVTPRAAAYQASLSFIISWSLLKLMSIESMMQFNHLIFCGALPFLPSIYPSSSHQMAKVSELQPQHQSFQWIFRTDFLYDGLVWSPCCPRDSQESYSAPKFESIKSLVLSLLYGPTLTSIHDYRKNHSFDYTDLCGQSNVSAF